MTDKKRFRIPRFYKTLLALAVIVGPISWLMFTEDGRRRTDLMVLGFQDAPLVQMRLAPLSSAFTEEQLREFLPDIQWQCNNNRTRLGERSCTSAIGAFNDTPAHYLVMYFQEDALQAMKVAYRRGYHEYLVGLLTRMLGGPKDDRGVLRWATEQGLILLPRELAADTPQPTMMWLSAAQVMQPTE